MPRRFDPFDEIEKAVAKATPAPCAKHCEQCEGEDHHWMPDYDDETDEPLMVCKHCEATREIRDGDLEE